MLFAGRFSLPDAVQRFAAADEDLTVADGQRGAENFVAAGLDFVSSDDLHGCGRFDDDGFALMIHESDATVERDRRAAVSGSRGRSKQWEARTIDVAAGFSK